MKPQKVSYVTPDGRQSIEKRHITGPRRCGKNCFTSKKVAKAHAVQLRKELGEPIEAYKCYRCHSYHVGHPPGWREANGKRRSVVSRKDNP